MPKKFAGENSKAVAARARKEEKKNEEKIKKQKQAEEEYWKDDDRSIARKNQRKEEREKKKVESAEKKAEVKALLEQEMSSIKPVAAKLPLSKITRAQIQVETDRRAKVAQVEKPQPETLVEQPLEENVNRILVDGVEARSVEDAITALSLKEPEIDRHPERRLKAAFAAFEEANMPRIKAENPSLRLSQLKQILRKEWMKSPDNPLNQRL